MSSYWESVKSGYAAHHGKVLVATAVVAVVIIISVSAALDKCKASKSGFSSALNFGGNNPQWNLGSMDAGQGGSVDRAPTIKNLSTYVPAFTPQGMAQLKRARKVAALKAAGKNAEADAVASGGDGEDLRGTENYMGANWWEISTGSCGNPWDPSALAEAEALAGAGGFQVGPEAEARLNKVTATAISGGPSAVPMSDASLMAVMHSGGAP